MTKNQDFIFSCLSVSKTMKTLRCILGFTLLSTSLLVSEDSIFEAALAKSKETAMQRYPDLRDPNSAFFKYVASYTAWYQENKPWVALKDPSPFENPNWPLQLADACAEVMTKALAAQQKQENAQQSKNQTQQAADRQEAEQMLKLDEAGIIHLNASAKKALKAIVILSGG